MIYLKPTDPADAKPGDFLIESHNMAESYIKVKILAKTKDNYGKDGNAWLFIHQIDGKKYSDEIVDGKPTAELIARFTTPKARESGKRCEFSGWVYIRGTGGIYTVGPIQSECDILDNSYFFFSFPGESEMRKYNVSGGTQEQNVKLAEAERARLIAWLER